MRTPPATFLPIGLIAVLAACGGPPAPTLEPPKFEPKNETKAQLVPGADRPLVVEWPASDRGQLEALAKRGVVLVRYDGRAMELLDECVGSEHYEYVGLTPKQFVESVSNEDELKAKLPIGAVQLGAELRRSGKLNVRMTIVGRYEAPGAGASAARCAKATHAVRAITVGAFELFAGASAAVEGGASARGLGAAVGGAARGQHQTLSADGTEAACASSRSDAHPPQGCAAMIRVELAALGEPPKPPAAIALGEAGLRVVPIKPMTSYDVSRQVPPWEAIVSMLPPAPKKLVERLGRARAAMRGAQQARATAEQRRDECVRTKCRELAAASAALPVANRAAAAKEREYGEALAAAVKWTPPAGARPLEWFARALVLDEHARTAEALAANDMEPRLKRAMAAYERAAGVAFEASRRYYLGHAASDAAMLDRGLEEWRKALAAGGLAPSAAGELEWLLGSYGADQSAEEAVLHFSRAEEHWKGTSLEPVARYHLMYARVARGSFREALATALALAASAKGGDFHAEGIAVAARMVAQLGGMDRAPLQGVDASTLAAIGWATAERALESDDWFAAGRALGFVVERASTSWEAPRALERLIDLSAQLGELKRADELVGKRAMYTSTSPWAAPQRQAGKTDPEIAVQLDRAERLVLRGVDDPSASRALRGAVRGVLDICWGMLGNYDAPTSAIDIESEPVRRSDAKVTVNITPAGKRAPVAKRCIEQMAASALADSPAPIKLRVVAEYATQERARGGWK